MTVITSESSRLKGKHANNELMGGADSVSGQPKPRLFFGLLIRRTRYGLSWRGWLALFALLGIGTILAVKNVYPFLAVTHRVDADALVVEGWVHQFAIQAGVDEFKTGRYQKIYTTGGPVTGSGGYTWDADTSASVGAGELRKAGVDPQRVQMVPAHWIGRDRTYNSAVALRDWFHAQNIEVRGINIVTENVHARRTLLVFKEAFGNEVKVGVIAARNPDYDPGKWWDSSDGFRDVSSETIAYFYARLLFHSGKSPGTDQNR